MKKEVFLLLAVFCLFAFFVPEQAVAQTEITIQRANRPVYSGFKEYVYVDGVRKLVLTNGNSGKIVVSAGNHVIHAELYTLTSPKLEFNTETHGANFTITPYSLQNFTIEAMDGSALAAGQGTGKSVQMAVPAAVAKSAPQAAPVPVVPVAPAPVAAAQVSHPVATGPRYALVVGNAKYKNIGALKNPVNDATDMKAALESIGFKVDLITNANLEQMENAVVEFRRNLARVPDTYGFFFYAGHGVQSGGNNFLIPVDANIQSEN